MSRKYISQVDNQNFVFPNNEVAEYDVDIIHNINDNCVSGSVIAFSATTISSSGMTISFDYTWNLNGATPFVRNSGAVSVLSLHMMGPTQNYYKPFLTVGRFVFNNIPITSIESGVTPGFNRLSFVVTPAMLGLATFTTGTYYFEVKFIGERCVFPVCFSQSITVTPPPTPTPTSTPTPTPTSTSTPTPTPTPTVEPFSGTTGITLNITDTGYIKFNTSTGTTYEFVSSLGSYDIPYCADCATVMPGVPFADVAAFTITDCGTPCGVTPTPTPTATSTPTPTPTPPAPCYCYDIVVTGSTVPGPEPTVIATLDYNDCSGVRTVRSFTQGPGTYKQCIQRVAGVVQYFPEGTSGIDESYLIGVGVGNCNTGYVCTGYTPSVTPTPTPTPLPSQNIQVRECGTSSPTYGITINITGLVNGLAVKMNGGSGVLDGKCWEIIDANYTGTIDYTATHVSTSSSCATCVTPTPTPTLTPTPTATATPTPTPTIAPEVNSFTGCGYGTTGAGACGDAANNRTLYSDCDSGSFGVGCFVYIDTFPNPLTGYDFVFMNGALWDVNPSTGQVTAYSSEQC